jgi:diguanylate cyclase (GGDEF)-like protein/hemerythrin-like metal-binding protein
LDPFGALLSGSTLVRGCALDETRQVVLATTRGLRELLGLEEDPAPFPFLDLIAEADRSAAADALARQRDGTQLHAQRRGGDSFLSEVCFEGALVTFEDISERVAAEERLRLMALHDPLTGLPNRTLLQDRMHQALLEARRNRTLLGVMVLDLNRFKVINDEHGHGVGDEVLRVAARRFIASARETDTIARIGGDEFVIAAHLARREDAAVLAGRIVHALGVPIEAGNRRHSVGVSIGIAVSPDDGETIDELFHRADKAMYEAKNAGSHVSFAAVSRGEVLQLTPLVWSDALHVGVPVMDHQHRGIIELLNRVKNAVASRAAAPIVTARLADLLAAASAHFATEEQLLREVTYGGLEAHMAEHRSLLGDLRLLHQSPDFGDDVALALQNLDRWMIDHIEGFDRAAGRALVASGALAG